MTCFGDGDITGWHHVFVIGDWGGPMVWGDHKLKPADNTKLGIPRDFVKGVDDSAQQKVAKQMKIRAPFSKPDYILNVGDAFYWGGINTKCGKPPLQHDHTGQWNKIFEQMYSGPGLDGKQWLGVLGNHDYGGWHFTNGWDQEIGYTWTSKSKRWMMPAQYWSVEVKYPDFSVDYLFVDSNFLNAWEPHENPEHNICGIKKNPKGASCGVQGPQDVWACQKWFSQLWEAQKTWMDRILLDSKADWQVVVTHFPADSYQEYWLNLTIVHGVDLIISGHRHSQELFAPGDQNNFLRPSGYIISGGGGGITCEGLPSIHGDDDMYGFMDLSLSPKVIKIEAISHGGQLRRTVHVHRRHPGQIGYTTTVTTTTPTTITSTRTSTYTTRTFTSTATTKTTSTSTFTLTSVTTTKGTAASESEETPAPTPLPDTFTKAPSPTPKPTRHPSMRGQRKSAKGFSMTTDSCSFLGMQEILERETCIDAALDLKLPVTKLRTISNTSRIQGCYFLMSGEHTMLWLSTFPRYTKLKWKHLCQPKSETVQFA